MTIAELLENHKTTARRLLIGQNDLTLVELTITWGTDYQLNLTGPSNAPGPI